MFSKTTKKLLKPLESRITELELHNKILATEAEDWEKRFFDITEELELKCSELKQLLYSTLQLVLDDQNLESARELQQTIADCQAPETLDLTCSVESEVFETPPLSEDPPVFIDEPIEVLKFQTLSPAEIYTIRQRYAEGESVRQIADSGDFNVKKSTIGKVVAGMNVVEA